MNSVENVKLFNLVVCKNITTSYNETYPVRVVSLVHSSFLNVTTLKSEKSEMPKSKILFMLIHWTYCFQQHDFIVMSFDLRLAVRSCVFSAVRTPVRSSIGPKRAI